MKFAHKPIMVSECIEALNIKPEGIYVDGTLGGGGHSREICVHLSNQGTLVGIDQDISAIEAASQTLAAFSEQTLLVRGNFFDISNILLSLKIDAVDGFLLDLGVSSYQLDEPSRGFSYMHDAPLDMRMDNSKKFSAYEIVNHYTEKQLATIIIEYGEERWAKRIAQFIVEKRLTAPIQTTFELVSVIKAAIPKGARADGPHPAKRTFQAIRIEVNGELATLGETITTMVEKLKPGGRICVITFHSLEDRIIKNAFKDLENPCKCPIEIPMCVCGKTPVIKLITKRPLTPCETELEDNPRARSSKLRVAEKL